MYSPLFEALATLPFMRYARNLQAFFDNPEMRALVVRAETGAGKTLCVPTLLAEKYPDKRILVLEPNRFLASDAAETVAELTGRPLGETAAVAVGKSDGVPSQAFRRQAPITFSTFGYALHNQVLNNADIFVLDECHEQLQEQTAVEAILRHRLRMRHPIKIVVMSATLNADDAIDKWDDFGAGLIEIPGRPYECAIEQVVPQRDQPTIAELAQQCQRLLSEGNRGILVFAATPADCRRLADEIGAKKQFWGQAVEVATLTSKSNYRDRCQAVLPPRDGQAKILIGTKVIEAGVNIPWADAGVSDGMGVEKVLNPVTKAVSMPTQALSQWRLTHQAGRLGRFRPGRFVLLHRKAWNERPLFVEPEVRRLPLTSLVLNTAAVGIDARELEFFPTVDDQEVADAFDHLVATGLVSPTARLGEDGRRLTKLNLSLTGTLMLREAIRLKVLPQALPLIVTHEIGDFRLKLNLARPVHHGLSDLISMTVAFARANLVANSLTQREQRDQEFTRNNWSFRAFRTGRDRLDQLAREFNVIPDLDVYLRELDLYAGEEAPEETVLDAATGMTVEDALRMVILAAQITELFNYDHGEQLVWHTIEAPVAEGVEETPSWWYTDRDSVSRAVALEGGGWYATVRLREIVPHEKSRKPFTMAEMISLFAASELQGYIAMRPDWLRESPNADGTATVRSVHNDQALFIYQPPRDEGEDDAVLPEEDGPPLPVSPTGELPLGAVLEKVLPAAERPVTPAPATGAEVVALPTAPQGLQDKLEALRQHFPHRA